MGAARSMVAGGAIALMLAAGSAVQAQPSTGNWCTVGAKLDVLHRGVWLPATAKSNGAGGCLVGYDGYNASWDERVGPDRAGPRGTRRAFASGDAKPGAAASAPAPRTSASAAPAARQAPRQPQRPAASTAPAAASASAPAPAHAPAAAASGGGDGPRMGSYHCVFFINGQGLQTVPGFTLQAGDRYRHETGGTGRTRFDAGTGVLEFSGGPLDGQAGKVQGNGVHLFNEKRTRTVIDCDTK